MTSKHFEVMFGLVVFTLTFALGVLSVSLNNPTYQSHHYSHLSLKGKQLWVLKVREVLKSNPYSENYIAQVQFSKDKKTSGKILLSIARDTLHQGLKVDDEISAIATIKQITPPLNPHQFDYQAYMSNLGVNHRISLKKDAILILPEPQMTSLGYAARLRNHINAKLKTNHFAADHLAIIQALLLGQRNDISAETYTNYKNAGAVHILAVSGLHIGILLLLLQFLLRPLERLPKGKSIKLIVIVALLWIFAFVAGFSASVVRAVTMFSFVAYALYLNRPSNTFNILALSMFFILLIINPLLIFQVGFQMSYAAVIAIVWLFPILQNLINPSNGIVRYFWQLLSVSIAAQVGVLPISLFYFHKFPGLFFISNLLIVPGLGFVLGAGMVVIVLALIDALPEALASAYNGLIGLMNNIVAWVGQQEQFVFQAISFDAAQLIIAYIILLYAVVFLTKPNFKKAAALGIAVIAFQAYIFDTSYQIQQKQQLFIAHQSRNTILVHQNGSGLYAYSDHTDRASRLTTNYQIAERTQPAINQTLKNAYQWHDISLLRIDSSAVYPKNIQPHLQILLTGSPKLNLSRLLDSLQPKAIIADGSNYKSAIARWKITCAEKNVPFHYTGEKGAYTFTLDSH